MARYASMLQTIDETKVLEVLHRYYARNAISFERAARDAGIGVYMMIEYVRKHKLPIIWTDEDKAEGLRKVTHLMEKRGIKLPAK